MKFTDYRISGQIKDNLVALGFKRPTDIQYKAIPSILKGEDVLAIAQTGTGKTAAFAIPIVDRIFFTKKKFKAHKGVQCIIMVPTRELSIQITDSVKSIAKGTGVKALSLFGGVEQESQINALINGVDIVVATPGRMFDLASQGHLKLETINTLVLDEADHMLDLGFIKDIRDLVDRLPKKRQTLFFSATIDEKIKKLAYSLVNKPVRIQISPKNPVSKNVKHAMARIEMDDKRFFLERLIREHIDKKMLVFVRTKVRAERVLKALERVGLKSITIHGGKEQKDRFTALTQFKSGEVKVLIATDVSARGIDIPNVEFVVNYDLPLEVENYVHRVGRTGRGTQKGDAISFCSKEELPVLDEIQEYLGYKVKELHIDHSDYSETIDLTEEKVADLGSVLKEIELLEERKKTKKKKKKK